MQLQCLQRKASLAALGILGILVPGCGRKPEAAVSAEVVLARDRAADLGARARWSEALAVLEPLVATPDAPLEDLLRAAAAQLAIQEAGDRVERARPLVERAERLAADDARVLWCRYRMAALDYDLPAALTILRRLHDRRPEDLTVLLALASTLDDLEQPETEREAQELFRRLLAVPAEQAGSWRMTVLYKLAQSLIREGAEEEAVRLLDESEELEARGLTRPGVPSHEPDTLGAIPPHTPGYFEPEFPATELELSPLPWPASAGSATSVRALQLSLGPLQDVGLEQGSDAEELYSFGAESTLVLAGGGGIALASSAGLQSLHGSPVLDFVPFDRLNSGANKGSDTVRRSGDKDLDLLFLDAEGRVFLLENSGGSWNLRAEPLATLAGSTGLIELDHDHDGDIDLLVTSMHGPHLLRNDGLDGSGGFTEVSPEAGLPFGEWNALVEDLDRDNDVDLLLHSRVDGALALASNERGGRFSDASAELPPGARGERFVAADLDGDSWPDLALWQGAELTIFLRTELGGWRADARRLSLDHAATGQPRAVDFDLDGAFDLLWPCAAFPAAGLLAPGFASGGAEIVLGERFESPCAGAAALEATDIDGDLDLDLVRLDESGLRVWQRTGSGQGIALALQGHKDNARGVGAIVELRSGLRYRRLYYRGTPELVGFAGRPLDLVRVTWPNGVVQGSFGLSPGAERVVAQRVGLVGSCPFLYTWNGTTYEFVSDVLGITPLGLPMAPGLLVPPDHDEYVLVKGEQLVPREGAYELQLTEELREVTYLDRLRLDVIDHPADTEVFPNERFCFPPFPAEHTHVVRAPLAPLAAVDQEGRDWRDELARDDRSFALPFEPLPGPYSGLARPYTLELAFERERVGQARTLRLLVNGWFYWTDASVNLAAAAHPDHEFVPPLLSVPGEEGGWRECGPIGFPAGKLKTMVVDVSELLNRADPRLRLGSTLRLYWDSIRLAVDDDDAPLGTTPLDPSSAVLWQRGFSRPERLAGLDLEWFRWDALEPEPRWNQHPGLYTKLGQTLPLLTESDDRFVILGAGDALTVRFDARELPALPAGWRRDFLVYLDGWAKDRDPNTVEALYVEPLPFHGMSAYPYGPGERYPDDEAHRAYRREWNTRPATRWVEPLAPPAAVRP